MELELGPLRFGIVGAGRLGLAVGRALQAHGLELVHVSSASQEGRERATRVLGVPAHEDPVAASQLVDCIVVCVPDDELAATVQQLRGRPPRSVPIHLRVVSMSAAGGIAALAPLAELGHDIGVLHPIASVVDHAADPATLAGAGAAIGAPDDASRTFLHALAHALDLHGFDLAEEAWPLHAAACTLAANGPAMLLGAAEDLASEAGVHAGIARLAYGRLAAIAIERAITTGPIESIAGPIMRGDAASVANQVAAVRNSSSQVDAMFIPVVASVANRAFTSGRLDMQAHRELLEAVLDPSQFAGGEFRYRDDQDPDQEGGADGCA